MTLEPRLETSAAAAVRAAGGQAALARKLGISQSTVSTWLRRGNELPAKFVIPVEQAYGVSRHELRPDLYPPEERASATQPASHPTAQHPAAHPSAPGSSPLSVSGADGSPVSASADGTSPAAAEGDPLKGLAA